LLGENGNENRFQITERFLKIERIEKWLVYLLSLTDAVKENDLASLLNHLGLSTKHQKKV